MHRNMHSRDFIYLSSILWTKYILYGRMKFLAIPLSALQHKHLLQVVAVRFGTISDSFLR